MLELRSLLWLEQKRFGAIVDYVLRIFGVGEESNRFYAIYVAGLLVLWLFTAWAYLLEQVEFISRELPADTVLIATNAIPILIIVAQWIFLILALRESPLKMSAPDLALLATSPIRRALLVLVYCFKSNALYLLLIGIASTLVTMLFANKDNPDIAGIAGAWSFAVSVAFTWISCALIWAIALLKLHLPIRRYKIWFWLFPLLMLGLVALVPQPFLLMGTLWQDTIDAQFTTSNTIILVSLVIGSTALLMLSGARMHLTVMADESQSYARIQRIGFLGQIYARDVIARIKRQSQLGSSSRRYFSLPKSNSQFNSLWQRALLTLTRLAPMSLLNLLALGARYTAIISGSIILFGWQAPQVWLIVAVMLLQFRPTALIEPFQQTMELAFIRQFLPIDDIQTMILADSIIPIMLATIGGWLVLVTQTLDISAILLVPLGLIVLTLCQALTWFKPNFFGGQRIAYEYSTVGAGVFIIGIGYFTASLSAAVIASVLAIWALLGLIRDSHL